MHIIEGFRNGFPPKKNTSDYPVADNHNSLLFRRTVTDKSTGEALAGVNVIIDGTSMGAATDLDGTYYIIGIPPGEYIIIAMYVSYRETRISNVEVNIDKTTTINF